MFNVEKSLVWLHKKLSFSVLIIFYDNNKIHHQTFKKNQTIKIWSYRVVDEFEILVKFF